MFERFRRERAKAKANAGLVDDVFAAIAAAARRPAHYTVHAVADTVMGRYEMLALHMWLFQHRAKNGSPELKAMAQDVVDVFFREIDHTLREIGIGDTSVPKRMKKLARMVYGRWEAYGTALVADDRMAMSDALRRNVYAEGGDDRGADALADYAFRAAELLRDQPDTDFLQGRIAYPEPVETVEA